MSKKNKNLKVGLALSGGSALGISHIGVIKSLQENKIPIDCVSGTSAGSVVAACLAFGISLEKMIEVSKALSWSNVSDFGYSKFGLNCNKPVGKMIRDVIGDVNIEDAHIPLAIVAADIDTGEKIIFKKGNLAQAVMASTCIPAFFTPVKVGKRKLVDGGLIENLPFSPLKEMGAELEIGVNLGHWRTYRKTGNILDVINNSYGILIKNQAQAFSVRNEILIDPHLEKYTSSDFNKVRALLREGYSAANLVIPQIRKRLRRKRYMSRLMMRVWRKLCKFKRHIFR